MVNAQDDFFDGLRQDDPKLNALVESVMSTKVGKDRKTVLTIEQALQIARARTFADSFAVYEEQIIDGETVQVMIEPPLEIIHTICDYLENTAVSVQGKGLKDLVAILTARERNIEDMNLASQLSRKVTG